MCGFRVMLRVASGSKGPIIAEQLDLPTQLLQGVAAACRGLASSTLTCSSSWRTHALVQHQRLAQK